MKARRIILKELDQIALLISRETGKPVAEAISMETHPVTRLDAVSSRAILRVFCSRNESISACTDGWPLFLHRQQTPGELSAVFSPWNFPWVHAAG
jgi:acyl-CoA reductase-like NAD-dependent aldehyde dehydrogenase